MDEGLGHCRRGCRSPSSAQIRQKGQLNTRNNFLPGEGAPRTSPGWALSVTAVDMPTKMPFRLKELSVPCSPLPRSYVNLPSLPGTVMGGILS